MIPLATRFRAVVHYTHFLHSLRKVSKLYNVSKSSLHRWIKKDPRALAIAKQVSRRRRASAFSSVQHVIKEEVEANPFTTMDGLSRVLKERCGLKLARTTVGRYRAACGFAWKKAFRTVVPKHDPQRVRAFCEAHIHSYSSAQYYQKAMFDHSRRRTDRWNAETEDVVAALPTPKTADVGALETAVRAMLPVLPGLLEHRRARGYRKMRFLRYCRRKRAIAELVDAVAPPDAPLLCIGFGDWNGGSKSPVSRRTCGPLQEIKFQLSRRPNVWLSVVDEYKTSQMCSCCQQKLCNMKAAGVITKRDGSTAERFGRVHQVLHCRNSEGRSTGRCNTTWNRDANAALNLLVITKAAVEGRERPPAMRREPVGSRRQGVSAHVLAPGPPSASETPICVPPTFEWIQNVTK